MDAKPNARSGAPARARHPPRGLPARARKITPPKNYLVGVPTPDLAIPGGIIIFRRDCRGLRLSNVAHANLDRHVLIVNLRGQSTIVLDEHGRQLRPGGCLLVFPGQFHYYPDVTDRQLLWLFITFKMPDDQKLEALRNRIIMADRSRWRWIELLTDTYRQKDHATPPVAGRLTLYLWQLLLELTHAAPAAPVPPIPDNRKYTRIFAIHQYLREHVRQPIHIADVAGHVHMSSSSLRAFFKDSMHISLGQFIHLTRMHHAAEQLAPPDATISAVAEQCGFSGVYAFSRAFKQHFGMSPRAYRRQLN